jgi:hypothetical protein
MRPTRSARRHWRGSKSSGTRLCGESSVRERKKKADRRLRARIPSPERSVPVGGRKTTDPCFPAVREYLTLSVVIRLFRITWIDPCSLVAQILPFPDGGKCASVSATPSVPNLGESLRRNSAASQSEQSRAASSRDINVERIFCDPLAAGD